MFYPSYVFSWMKIIYIPNFLLKIKLLPKILILDILPFFIPIEFFKCLLYSYIYQSLFFKIIYLKYDILKKNSNLSNKLLRKNKFYF